MELDQDTLQMAHDIESAGLERKPAEAISRAIHQHGRQLATKADVERLEKSTGERFDRLEKSTNERFGQIEMRLNQMNVTIIGFGSALILTLIGGFVTLAFAILTNAGPGAPA